MASISQVTLPDNNTYDIKAKELAPQSKTISNVAIASFSDGADNVPVSSLIVDIDAVQDLHGYDKPWGGGAGKNKLDIEGRTVSTSAPTEETIYLETCSIVKNGATLTATATGAWSKVQLGISGLAEGETYTLSASFSNPSETTVGLVYYSNGWKGNKVSTATSVRLQMSFVYDSSVERVALIVNNKTTSAGEVVTISDIQLELGSTATSFEPYENICQIEGWSECNIHKSGINLWDEVWELGTYDTNGETVAANDRIRSKNYIPCLGNTEYYYKCERYGYFYFYDNNKTYISNVAKAGNSILTTPTNAKFIRFRLEPTYGTTYNNDISINYPATDTDYHSYNGTTYPISLGDTYYGGTLNVTNGILTIGGGYDNAQNMSWVKHGTNSNNIYYSNSKQSIVKKPQDGYTPVGGLSCSVAEEKTWESLFVSGVSGIAIATTGLVAIALPTITSLEDFNAIANQIQIVYPLATPTTVQLTPTEVRTLLNDNNIFADTGDINELVYFKTGCESITELIDVMHDDSKMSYSNAYYKKTCNQLTDPGIYYNIDPTGSPAEGYPTTTLITTYNCQILVYLGLVVNTRRVNHSPSGTISFGSWMRLANENDLDGAIIPYNAEYPSLGTIYDVIESIRSPSTQTVTLAANSWDSSTHLITVSVTDVTSTSVQDVIGLPATSSANISNNEALQDANIMDAGQSTGSLTFYAENVPTTDLQIRVIVRG